MHDQTNTQAQLQKENADLKLALQQSYEAAAQVCERLESMMVQGGGETRPGERLAQAARMIRALGGQAPASKTLWEHDQPDGSVAWYFDCDNHRIDVSRNALGQYAVHFINRIDNATVTKEGLGYTGTPLPQDWKVVPMVADEAMQEAAEKAQLAHLIADRKRGGHDPELSCKAIFAAMVKAAPAFDTTPFSLARPVKAEPVEAGVHSEGNGVTTFTGMLSLHSHGEGGNVLFLSSLQNPLAEEMQDRISRKTVTARYWITDQPVSKEAANEGFMRRVMGDASCDFGAHYSEVTGFLWMDEEVKIGGHDLIAELRSHVGKWLILEIEVHKKSNKK